MRKFLIFNRQGFTAYLFCLLFLFLVFLLSGCGDGGDDSFSFGPSESGSASFTVAWHDNTVIKASENTLIPMALNCQTAGVSMISCNVYDGGSNEYLVSGGPWPCSAGTGIINNIPVGTNREFFVFGEDGTGNILYHAKTTTGKTITAGQTTDVGTLDAYSFVPTLIEPENGSSVTINQFSLSWNSVQNAYEYRIQVSQVSNFSTTIINQTTTDTTFTPSGILASTTYYWRVFARDMHGNQGVESEVRSFTTNPEIPEIPWYRDADSDGYGDPKVSQQSSTQPDGYVSNNTDCNDDNELIHPGATEICDDGVDQDCNGSDLVCPPNPNDVDNDGDGYTENQGDCNDNNKSIHPGATEVCNGLDDDCDSAVDNGIAPKPTSCGIGECASTGVETCVNGKPVDSCTAGSPAPEVCDGLDNDCDGTVDDGIATQPTSCGIGECASTGVLACVDGKTVNSCIPGTPVLEVCDGLDNDCDGTVDNGIAPKPTSCGIGECASTGVETCVNGKPVDSCTPGTPVPEVCDGLDNDCDGTVDNGIAPRPTSCGIGECASTGVETCVNGKPVDSCTAGSPSTEICNDGVDNDCDGDIDCEDSECPCLEPTSSFTARLISGQNVLVGDANDKEGMPFNSSSLFIKEGTSDRTCLEFDIYDQPPTGRVHLNFKMRNLDDPSYTYIKLHAYLANGLCNASDYYGTDDHVYRVFSDYGASGTNSFSVDITDVYTTYYKAYHDMSRGPYLGLNLRNELGARYDIFDPYITISSGPLKPLPDTGQTTSYTSIFGEDSDYNINPPSYTDNGNGTILDNVTGLMWQQEDDDITRNYDDAVSYCNNLTLAGHNNWRLPSKMELMSIVNYSRSLPAINTNFFPGTNNNLYWSYNSEKDNPSNAWYVYFAYGGVGTWPKSDHYYVRCVRNGQ